MSNEKLIIPKKCKVGFNLRNDTYTGKLGYIIYNDGKVWRKENSWESWRQKEGNKYWNPSAGKKEIVGSEINPIEFDNVPMTGFVLNKKAGGYSTGWNHRSTYCRVFDPRGFEFEINIPNLLFILQETNSMKGKGLEGEFVYSWDGKDLVLLPCDSQDYQKSQNFTNLQTKKVSARTLIVGATYTTKKNEEVVYLGKLSYCDYETSYESFRKKVGAERAYTSYYYCTVYNRKLNTKIENRHIFYKKDKNLLNYESFIAKDSAGFLAECKTEEQVLNFADIVVAYSNTRYAYDLHAVEYVPLTIDDFEDKKPDYYTCIGEKKMKNPSTIVSEDGVSMTIKWNGVSHGKGSALSHISCTKTSKYDFTNWTCNDLMTDIVTTYGSLEELLEAEKPQRVFFVSKNGNKTINNFF